MTAAPLPELTRREKILTLVGIVIGLLLAALDQTIVATAGPAIQQDLHVEPSLYAWITTSYLVTSTVMVPIWGKLSDLFGRRRILLSGIVVFLVGSAFCGFSQTTWQLIAARALQGIGSAALFTSAFAVIADLFPPAERGKYQGLTGGVWGLSSVVGPLAGGFITDQFGWNWVFFVNLPIGAVALAFIATQMPPLRRNRGPVSVDWPGALLLILFAMPLLIALSLGRTVLRPGETGYLWGSAQILGLFAASLVGLVLFLWCEARAKEPLLDLTLFRDRTFATANAGAFAVGATFLSAIVFLPLFMVNVVGLSATDAGLTVMPLTMGIVAGNIGAGQLVSRLGRYKGLMLGSLVLLAASFMVMGFTLTPDSTQASVTLRMILVGLGLGPTIPLYTLAAQNAVKEHQLGVATSTATFLRQMGSTIGLAVLGTVFGTTLSGELDTRMHQAGEQMPPALHEALGSFGGLPEQGVAERGFDVEAIKAQVSEQFEGEEKIRALAKVDELHEAFTLAFTEAISLLYRLALLISLVAIGVTLLVPARTLRRTHGPPAME